MQKVFQRIILVSFLLISLSSAFYVFYQSGRVRPQGNYLIMSPGDTHIVSETVVEDGVLASDYIFRTQVKIGSPSSSNISKRPVDSEISKAFAKFGIRLLDMFVCNVDGH